MFLKNARIPQKLVLIPGVVAGEKRSNSALRYIENIVSESC